MSSYDIMSLNTVGWYVVSTTGDKTWNEAVVEWGIGEHTVDPFIYELSGGIINGDVLDTTNWTQININLNQLFHCHFH